MTCVAKHDLCQPWGEHKGGLSQSMDEQYSTVRVQKRQNYTRSSAHAVKPQKNKHADQLDNSKKNSSIAENTCI